jgi:protein-tyrosine phosphatase
MRRIEPYSIWLGNAADGRDYRRLFDAGIRAVVQLAIEEPYLVAPRELIVLRCPLHDGGNESGLVGLAVELVARLLRSKIPSLVCCSAGMSRSPAVAATAIALVERADLSECLERVTQGRPADVSTTLWQELLDFADATP